MLNLALVPVGCSLHINDGGISAEGEREREKKIHLKPPSQEYRRTARQDVRRDDGARL